MPVHTRIVQIGNSRGMRIPKTILTQCHLDGTVELVPRVDGLLVRPVPSASPARVGWEEAFRTMGQSGDDAILDEPPSERTEWENEGWEW